MRLRLRNLALVGVIAVLSTSAIPTPAVAQPARPLVRYVTPTAIDFGPVTRWFSVALFNDVRAMQLASQRAETVRHQIGTAPTSPRPVSPPVSAASWNATGSVNGYPCGGALPSCCTLQHESGGNPRARNPSGAAGLWQFMPGTWAGFGGYASAADAPWQVQNQRAVQVFAGGAGASNWYGDGCYNGR